MNKNLLGTYNDDAPPDRFPIQRFAAVASTAVDELVAAVADGADVEIADRVVGSELVAVVAAVAVAAVVAAAVEFVEQSDVELAGVAELVAAIGMDEDSSDS